MILLFYFLRGCVHVQTFIHLFISHIVVGMFDKTYHRRIELQCVLHIQFMLRARFVLAKYFQQTRVPCRPFCVSVQTSVHYFLACVKCEYMSYVLPAKSFRNALEFIITSDIEATRAPHRVLDRSDSYPVFCFETLWPFI